MLIVAAGGVPSLLGVLREIRSFNAVPLFSLILQEEACDRIAAAVADADGGTRIDLILGNIAQRCVLRGVHGEEEILTHFVAHAHELANCVTFDDLVGLDPNARFAVLAPTESVLAREDAERRLVAMYATYRQEISNFFVHARPVLHPRPKHLRKEKPRDLFAATG